MNIETAKALKSGAMIHHVQNKNRDGTPMRARVTSVKTWKTRPGNVEVHVKHGMYDYAIFDQDDINLIEAGEK
jgi:hypothetical protein